MAKAKKTVYVDAELQWLDQKLLEIREFVDANPYNKITDRIEKLESPKGVMDKVVATIETQQTSIRAALKDYAIIVETVNNLRKVEAEKQEAIRGGEDLTPFENGEI